MLKKEGGELGGGNNWEKLGSFLVFEEDVDARRKYGIVVCST